MTILQDIKKILVDNGYNAKQITIQSKMDRPEEETSLQDKIYIIGEPAKINPFTNVQTIQYVIYVAKPDSEQSETTSKAIRTLLNNRREGAGLVSDGYLKMLLTQAITFPYPNSVTTTGANTVEYATKYKTTYLENINT